MKNQTEKLHGHSTFLKMGLAAAVIVAVAGAAIGVNTQDTVFLLVSPPVGLAVAGLTVMFDFMNQYDKNLEEKRIWKKELHEINLSIVSDSTKVTTNISQIRNNSLSHHENKAMTTHPKQY